MPRELIHIDDHRSQLHCDNPRCGYDLPEGAVTWGAHLIGFPCPKCDSNMLTRADYEASERIFAAFRWINKWFGWLGKEYDPADTKSWPDSVSVHHHAGITSVTTEKR